MGFLSGLGRGLRGMLDGAAGTQALLAGDHGAYGRMRAQQARLRAAQAKLAEARQMGLVDNLVKQGIDPAQVGLALANPDFARSFLPGLAPSQPAGTSGGSAAHESPDFHPEGTHGFRSADVEGIDPVLTENAPWSPPPSAPGDDPEARAWPNPSGLFDDGLSGANAIKASIQDGFDRGLDVRIAQERARETGRDYRDILREMRQLPARQSPSGPGSDAGAPKPPSPPHNSAEEDRVFRAKLGQGGLNGFGYIPSETDVNLMARALFSEFGQVGNWEDMWAGAWSMVNRVRPRGQWPTHRGELGRTLPDVIFRRGRNGVMQYSFAPPGGLGAAGGSRGWRESATPDRLTGDSRKAWDLAVLAASEVLGGDYSDPTGGSTYFHNEIVGTPEDVRGFFGNAYRGEGGRSRTIGLSPYRSPNKENYFYYDLTEPPHPILARRRLFPSRLPQRPSGGK